MAKVLEFPAERIVKGVHHYTPEMGQKKSNCQMQARISHMSNYLCRIYSPFELKGRGIKHYKSEVNHHIYYVTELAFKKLKEQYSISMESNLD